MHCSVKQYWHSESVFKHPYLFSVKKKEKEKEEKKKKKKKKKEEDEDYFFSIRYPTISLKRVILKLHPTFS